MAKPNSKNTQRIKLITEKIIGLPTLPTVISKMIELVDNPKTSASSLAKLISTDQALTAKILKISNSAYYGYSREISTVDIAIVVMGFNAVKEMGLSLSVLDVFKDLSNVGHFDVTQYWQHSVGCGVAAKMLASKYKKDIAGEAFVAGLLHDVGKIIINQYLYKEFVAIIKRVASKRETFDDIEEDVLGTNHGQIGSWLVDKWRLPVMISKAIKYHHSPWEARKHRVMIAIVNLANYLCHACGVGNSGRITPPTIADKTWDIFQSNNIPLSDENIENLQMDLFVELDKTETLTSLLYSESD